MGVFLTVGGVLAPGRVRSPVFPHPGQCEVKEIDSYTAKTVKFHPNALVRPETSNAAPERVALFNTMGTEFMKQDLVRTAGAAARLGILTVVLAAFAACSKPTPDQLLGEAQQFMTNRDFISAELKLEQFLKDYPGDPNVYSVYMGLAQCSISVSDYEKARMKLDSAAEIAGGAATQDGIQARMMAADTFMREGRPGDAIAAARALSEELAEAPVQMQTAGAIFTAKMLREAGRAGEARAMMRAIIEEGPSDGARHTQPMQWLVEDCMSNDAPTSAAMVYEDYLERYPESSFKEDILMGIGLFSARAGDEAKGEKYFGEAVALINEKLDEASAPDESAQLLFKLAGVERARGDLEAALAALETLIEEQPSSGYRPSAMHQAIIMEAERGNYDAVRDWCQRIQIDYPNTQYFTQAEQVLRKLEQVEAMIANAATTGTLANDAATSAPLGDDASTSGHE